jgi:hypothetical protein
VEGFGHRGDIMDTIAVRSSHLVILLRPWEAAGPIPDAIMAGLPDPSFQTRSLGCRSLPLCLAFCC